MVQVANGHSNDPTRGSPNPDVSTVDGRRSRRADDASLQRVRPDARPLRASTWHVSSMCSRSNSRPSQPSSA